MNASIRRLSLTRRVVHWAVAALALTGCSRGDGKLPLAGSVTLDGVPVSQGTLVMTAGGAAATGVIDGGTFEIAADKGLPRGTYQVRIVAYELTGREIPDNEFPDRMVAERRQIIPEIYNDRSELLIDLTADNASKLEFALKTR
jgi:hypothetical protein